MGDAALLMSGLAMGFAGSLHCSCVCGGIASSLLMAARPADAAPMSRIGALAAIQAGRALTYTVAGAVVGSAGWSFAGILSLGGLQPVARSLGALVIVAVGLSMAGILPWRNPMAAIASSLNARMRALLPSRIAGGVPLLTGMAWGFAPCAMVYNALLIAMLTGSAFGGALFMSGFALATIPAVGLTAYGAVGMVRVGGALSGPRLKTILGTLFVILGLASATLPNSALAGLCIPR